ncbi:hypothetical protein MRB53_023662 [Persea americana]|uniref:Uncharacterized protein n=1 Tax=Persea americana TaxID=3435 RepID=A0ACC2LA26_PERAE|nr:hypothetical protein MRB53_023662 [Persea americana]
MEAPQKEIRKPTLTQKAVIGKRTKEELKRGWRIAERIPLSKMIRQLRWGWREAERTGRDPESEKIGSGDGTDAVELQRRWRSGAEELQKISKDPC